MHKPHWIHTDSIICAWKPCKGSKSKTTTIPKKHIDFGKDNLACIAATKKNIENGNDVEDGDGEI